MTTFTFDTHEFFNELKVAGFSEQQAKVITKLQKSAVASTLEQVRNEDIATKCDLNDLELRLVKWGIGPALGQVAVIAALVKLL